jgi:hypothetical protein
MRRFLLDDYCSMTNGISAYQAVDPDFHNITASQLAVDGEVEQCPISHSLVLIKEAPDA